MAPGERAVRRLNRLLPQVVDDVQLFRALYEVCSDVVDTSIFFLGVYNDVAQTVQVVRQMEGGVELPGGAFPVSSGFTSQAIQTREPVLIRDWSRGPHVQVQYATEHAGLPRSSLTMPLVFADRLVAVLSAQSYRRAAYDEHDLQSLKTIVEPAAAAIASLHGGRTEVDAITANMLDALLVVDGEGRIVRLNHAARRLLCLEDSSIVLGKALDRQNWSRAPADARELAEMLEPMLVALCQGEAPQDVDVELRTRRRVFNFTGTPLRDIGGGLSGGVLVFRDVTSRREVERLKDEIVSIASHDLRTPLGVIKGQAQILRRSVKRTTVTPEEIEAATGMIIAQSDRVTKLLTRLLDFSRLEAGALELELEPVDLRMLIDRSVHALQLLTDRHQLQVNGPQQVEGVWDEQRITEVIDNLVSNAIKFTPRGGQIAVSISTTESDTVTVSVQDHGVGLTPSALKHVFERYYRAGRTRRMEGSGLGLYICEGIVNAHGGRIWAQSSGRGRGSTFSITLPRVTRVLDSPGVGAATRHVLKTGANSAKSTR